MDKGFVYILECADGTFYTGSTKDIELRLNQHQNGIGAKYTAERLPVKLIYVEEFTTISEAFYREKQIQGWSRKKKVALINKKIENLPKFSECNNETHYTKKASTPLSHRNENSENNEKQNIVGQSRSYSNGKLLITGEYFVLEGAKSLAVPTKFGQDLVVEHIKEPQLIWGSFTEKGSCWLEAVFDLPKLRLVNASFNSEEEGGNDNFAENLNKILLQVRALNPDFLNSENGFLVKTNVTFPKNWGLGTSSTLINNLASWAKVNPYKLLATTFGGSGYDIACAQHNSPILYTKTATEPIVEEVIFNPEFKEQLYFVYLNKKQNSREGIQRFNTLKGKLISEVNQISSLTEAILKADNLHDFEKLLFEHEKLVSKTIQLKPVQELLFSDYFGQTKSLGAWGGDFILATGNDNTLNYFKQKGFETVIPYRDLIL